MKTAKSLLIVLLIFVIIPGFGYLFWIMQKDTKIDLMVVNKTVEKVTNNEFRSLNWVLNYNKIVKSSSNSYDYKKDYFGYHPEPVSENRYIQSFKLSDLSLLKEKYEGLIFLDSKGIGNNKPGITGSSYYGGFNQSDFLLLKEMSNDQKLIIAEYNIFSEPTEDLVRFNTEQLLDVYSVNWEGIFLDDLEQTAVIDNLDSKWLKIYSESTGLEWDFAGSGLVFVNEKQSRILVLPSELYMTENYPSIVTSADLASFYGVKESLPFSGWFQMVYEGKNDVISNFELNLNEAGKQLLMNSGMEYHFPATIALANPNQYFFAGDFSKQNVVLACSKNRVVSELMHIFCRMRGNSPSQFFHNYYLPMYSTIINNYLSSQSNDLSED